MVLVELPDVPPRPPTPANAAFRRWFYERWGRENALVLGRARRADFAPYTQTLSVKRAWGGREDYLLDRRRLAVDDGRWLVLNEGRHYGARIDHPTPVTSLAVFFRPGMSAELAAAAAQAPAAVLDDPAPRAAAAPGFAEHLRPAGGAVEVHLLALRDAALAGTADDDWLEERLQALLWSLLEAESGWRARRTRLAAWSRSTQAELLRRVDLAADFMLSESARPLTLDDVAGAAQLSKYHLVRVFRAVHGETPFAFLGRARAARAQRLLADPGLTLDEVAVRCGFGSRQTLFRQLRRHCGAGGRALRPAAPPECPSRRGVTR